MTEGLASPDGLPKPEFARLYGVWNDGGAGRLLFGNIADMAVYAWYGALVEAWLYDAGECLDAESYTNVVRWAKGIRLLPALQRGRRVNRTWGNEESPLAERHHASDLD